MTPADLKKIRAKMGLSQTELANRLGVARNTVTRWEVGLLPIRPPVEKLIRLTYKTR